MFIRFLNFSSNAIIPTGSSELFLSEILNETTKKNRRWLLSSSLVCLLITIAEIIPTKISALGIDFSTNNQASLLKVFSLVLIYFLITFCVNAWSDFVIWRVKIINNRKSYYENIRDNHLNDDQNEPTDIQVRRANHIQKEFIEKVEDSSFFLECSVLPLTIIKTLWELALPIVVAIFSTFKLVTYF